MLDTSETSCPWHRTMVTLSVRSISRVRQSGAGWSGIRLSLFAKWLFAKWLEWVRESFSYIYTG